MVKHDNDKSTRETTPYKKGIILTQITIINPNTNIYTAKTNNGCEPERTSRSKIKQIGRNTEYHSILPSN